MARRPGINADFTFDGFALEAELNSAVQSIDNTLTEVTAFADDGAEFVEGLHNAKFSLSGASDFGVNKGDQTIFEVIGNGERPVVFQPTGTTDAADHPNYKANVLVTSYTITSPVGGAVTYTVDLQDNGPVDRDVTP